MKLFTSECILYIVTQQECQSQQKEELERLHTFCKLPNLELMRYCAIPTASGVPVIVTSRS